VVEPSKIKLTVDGKPLEFESSYDSLAEALQISGVELTPAMSFSLTLETETDSLLSQRERLEEKVLLMVAAFRMNTWAKHAFVQRFAEFRSDPLSMRQMADQVEMTQALALLEVATGRSKTRLSYVASEAWSDLLATFGFA
jgi:hypothetical protein